MGDSSDNTDSSPSAFIAAALVLVALPLVILVGVVALALASYVGILPGLGNILNGEASLAAVMLLVVWVLVAVAGTLTFAVRVARRSA